MKSMLKFILVSIFRLYYLRVRGVIWAAQGYAFLEQIKNRGCRCVLEGAGVIYEPEKLTLGDDVFIGRNFFIRAKGGIAIGSYTHISRNVVLHTVNPSFRT